MENDKIISVETLLDRVSTSWNGDKLKSYPSGEPTFTMERVTIAPHTKMESHSHTIMQIGYILSGELTITTEDGNSKTFHKGEPAIEVVGKIHYGENRSDESTEVLIVSILGAL